MKKVLRIFIASIFGLSVIACASVSKMAELAENVKVTCDPEVLTVVAGKVDADIAVTYPDGYFHPKAVLEVTPVVVTRNGETGLAPFTYQGVKVKDNYAVVSSEGQTVKESVHFEYKNEMENCHLELRGVVRYKDKSWELPVRKVAVGCKTVSTLAFTDGVVSPKSDNYLPVLNQTAEGQIFYAINSSNVNNKELKSQSIEDFRCALDAIGANERMTLKNTEIIAYASPDGGEKLNSKLSDRRAKSAEKVWGKVIEKRDIDKPDVESVGQDWEGFQELVRQSNIPDKDLILRVLSMYSDPAVRESEIKNMSEVFTVLKKTILPELRRARFIANVEFENYSNDELLSLIEQNSDILDEEALLRAATLVKNNEDKETLYEKAVKKYDSDRARFNLGSLYLCEGNEAKAEKMFADVVTKDESLTNAQGVLALRKGDVDKAVKLFKDAGTDDANKNIGGIYMAKGDYEKALKYLEGTGQCNEAIIYLMNDQPQKALSCLKCDCPKANYIKAIASARLGNSKDVADYLGKASADKELKERMKNDLEFARYNVVIK